MRILIIGDGKVGYALAEQLSLENHQVTIVDNNQDALRKAVEKLDVLCVQGSGSSKTALLEAGIAEKDLVIVVTSSDEINMVCALLTHKLSNARIIARIRNPEYAESEDFIKDTLGIDMLINPELFAASEISRLLRFPHALSVETFARGKVEIIEFKLPDDAPFFGKTLAEITPKMPSKVLIGLVKRGGEVFAPNGGTVIERGDHVYMVGTPQQNMAFARMLGIVHKKLRSVLIVGGSRIGYYLASQIQRMGMATRIIERDQKRCEELYQLLPDTLIIQGDGTDHELLEQERLSDMDAFVALTDRDEENIVAGLHAKDIGVPKVVVKVTRPYYAKIVEGLSTISPKALTANRIVRYVRGIVNSEGSFVEQLYRIADGAAEVLEFTATSSARVLQTPLRQLRLKKGLLVAAIMHKGHVTVPFGDDVIREGDTVIIVSSVREAFLDINDILVGG